MKEPIVDSSVEGRLGPLGLAYSGPLLGGVAAAFAVDSEFLKSRTARRFFAGEILTDANRQQMFMAMAGVLVDAGAVETSEVLCREDVARALEEAALRWDETLAGLQSRAGLLGQAVTVRALRFAVVDLALRVFAVLRLGGGVFPEPDTPLWATSNGGGKLLRRLTREAGLTREELAERLDLSDNAVDNWLDGRNRPAYKSVRALALTLAPDGEVAAVERTIRWTYALSALATRLADELGGHRVEALATALVRFVRAIGNDVSRMERPPIEESARTELVALWYGTAHPMSHPLLRNLAAVEKDVEWRRDILASMRPWGMELERTALRVGGPGAAGLAQEAPMPTNVTGDVGPPGAADADRSALAALRRLVAGTDRAVGSDLARKADQLRSMARRHPGSPRVHFEAGAFMGMAGKWLGRRELIDDGVAECWIAARLSPGWDAPAVEPGVILCNIGEFAEALSHLERAEEWLGMCTPHLLQCRGYAKMGLSRHGEALVDLEAVLVERPDHGIALGWAARCAFAVGDRRKGLTLARRAMRFGSPDEYLAWWNRRQPSA